jgi:antitoxin component of MazEF toxin-antitoxin module
MVTRCIDREVPVVKRLTKHGNSLALVIDRSILELLRIDADTPLSITTDGECLVISPARGAGRQRRFRRALEKVNRRYGRALRKLAD